MQMEGINFTERQAFIRSTTIHKFTCKASHGWAIFWLFCRKSESFTRLIHFVNPVECKDFCFIAKKYYLVKLEHIRLSILINPYSANPACEEWIWLEVPRRQTARSQQRQVDDLVVAQVESFNTKQPRWYHDKAGHNKFHWHIRQTKCPQ